MKFAQDIQHEGYVITSYDSSSICINGKPFNSSLIVAAGQLQTDWDIVSVAALQANHIEQLLSLNPEVIIIGTGNSLVFPTVEVYAAIIKQGIGIEFMGT